MPDAGDRVPPFLNDGADLSDGIALCLSGGGYRAMLFHAGALWRMNELGLLARLDMVSAVSGGALAAGALAVAWDRLSFDAEGRASNLRERFLAPVLRQSEHAVDAEAIALGLLPFEAAWRHVASSLEANLLGGQKTLLDLPITPRFVFNATNLMSGRDFRFSRDRTSDWRVGVMPGAAFGLADAMAASAAFPPYLSPATLDLRAFAFAPAGDGETLHSPPYTERAVLADGGVYDNLGLEPAWKRYRTILASDAGRPFAAMPDPPADWLGQLRRVVDVMSDQDRALRLRVLVYAYRARFRTGALWGLDVAADGPGGRPPLLDAAEHTSASAIRTRLDRFLAGRAGVVAQGRLRPRGGWTAPALRQGRCLRRWPGRDAANADMKA